ncbi:MAG: hypothetical protein KKA06_04330, partial [Nanoarchaeota archaeon]|nr:hypothetical protein [Nanoarchaeota archaeon]
EQGNTIPLDSEGDKLKDGVLKNYYDELSNFHPQPAFDEFLFHKLKSDSIKALSYYFLDHNDLIRQKTAKKFIENSIHSIDRLINNYSTELDSKNLINLKEAETKLLMIEK